MTSFTDHPACTWVGADPFTLPIYAERFDGAVAEIMGESPYINAKDAGISFALTRKHLVETVFLYSEGFEGFSAYTGALPMGLSFANSRTEVRTALGEPVRSGEAGGIGLMAIEHSWDRFEADALYLHIQYQAGDAGILLITIGIAD